MTPVIVAERLTRRFGRFLAVDQVSFEVARGEIFGYLGANGAGKSTTIRMLTGLLAPSSGRATVAGADVERDPEAVKASIGYMSQRFSLYLDLPVIENLRFFGGAYGLSGRVLRCSIDEALSLTGLGDLEQALTGSLPGGVRQRLALASALMHRPSIVFLDEPTAGVDPAARRAFWSVIKELAHSGTTVFVTTHYLDEAEYCGRIGLMVDGRLVALDSPDELKRRFVPERVFVVRGHALGRAAAAVASLPGVHSVTPFGAGLHLRVGAADLPEARLSQVFVDNGAEDVDLEPSEPSLEDVFLAVVGQASAAKEASA